MPRNSTNYLLGRGALAAAGGYATAALGSAAIGRALPIDRLDATLLATISSFSIFVSIAVIAFAAETFFRAARSIALILLVSLALLASNA